jgi:hypothetical protein
MFQMKSSDGINPLLRKCVRPLLSNILQQIWSLANHPSSQFWAIVVSHSHGCREIVIESSSLLMAVSLSYPRPPQRNHVTNNDRSVEPYVLVQFDAICNPPLHIFAIAIEAE